MRQVDQPETFGGIVTDSQGRAKTTNHQPPQVKTYADILNTQGMVHRDSFPPNSLKWVGEAADKWRENLTFAPPDDPNPFYSPEGLTWEAKPVGDWRGIHAQQAADMVSIMEIYRLEVDKMCGMQICAGGRKADRD